MRDRIQRTVDKAGRIAGSAAPSAPNPRHPAGRPEGRCAAPNCAPGRAPSAPGPMRVPAPRRASPCRRNAY